MKQIFTSLFVFLSIAVFAQITDEQLKQYPCLTLSNYDEYEHTQKVLNLIENGVYDFPTLSQAPENYQPFYISHYGRHGSRYSCDQKAYERIYNKMKAAYDANALTDFGLKVYREVEIIYNDAIKRAGDLSYIGRMQHKGIANRMMQNFPEVFDNPSVSIDAKSTMIMRCALSMMSFCEEIKAKHPNIQLRVDASNKFQYYMCNEKKSNPLEKEKEWQDKYNAWKQKYNQYSGDLDKRLFNNNKYVKDNVRMNGLTWNLYEMIQHIYAVDNIGIKRGESAIEQTLTTEDKINYWKLSNAYWYVMFGNCPDLGGKSSHVVKYTVENIIEEADKAIAQRTQDERTCCTLRFGHDTGLMPLIVFLNLDNYGYATNDFDTLHEHWCDFKSISMAGNLQIIFYKNVKDFSKDILVKFLINEREAHLPIEAYEGVYYKWNDVQKYMRSLIDEESAEPVANSGGFSL